MRILILGGYGAVGYETAKILLKRTDADIVIAGHNQEKAQSAAAKLAEITNSHRVSSKFVDAFDYNQVVRTFKTVDWVVICIPLTGLGGKLAQAAYEAGVHYIDINANHAKQTYLQSMAAKIEEKGFTFVTEAGLGPGVPSLLVFHAYEKLGKLHSVDIGSIFRESRITSGSAYDMLVELGVKHRVLKDGAWQRAKFADGKKIYFGPYYGEHQCYPFEFLELIKLPIKELGLRNLGFYSTGFNPVVDMLVLFWMKTSLYKLKVGLRLGVRIAMWAERFSKPPFGIVLQLDATAQNRDHMQLRLIYDDAYVATAIPLAACVSQMLESDLISQSGVHLMGHFLKPQKFLADISEMGMIVEEVM